MVYSLGAVFLVVSVILLLTWRSHSQTPQPVDSVGALEQAVSTSTFPILFPTPLPSGYKATSARFEPDTYGATGDRRWYVGFTTAHNDFVSLWQTTAPLRRILAATSNGGDCSTKQTVNGVEWTKCDGGKPTSRAYGHSVDGVTTVVSGTASFSELEAFINTLQVQSKVK